MKKNFKKKNAIGVIEFWGTYLVIVNGSDEIGTVGAWEVEGV